MSMNTLLNISRIWIANFSVRGETGDVGDLVRTISMDSTVMTRLKRDEVITPDNIQPNDVIVGLSKLRKSNL